MKKLNILCDMDDIIVDLLSNWLKQYNKDFRDNISVEEIWDFDLWKCVKPSCGKKIYDYIQKRRFFFDLPAHKGAIETVKKLHDDGHDITIVSSPAEAAVSYQDKVAWLKLRMPFLKVDDIILGRKKYLIKGDILIDDSPKNITAYRKHWPKAHILTVAYPYNQDCEPLVNLYARDYKRMEKAWRDIYKYISFLANS